MIKYFNTCSEFNNIVSKYNKRDVFLTKINALFLSYGLNNQIDFWYHYTDSVTGIICRCGNDYILSLDDKADFTEIEEFLNIFGYKSVLFDAEYPVKPKFLSVNSGYIMKKNNCNPVYDSQIIRYRNYKEVYRFLKCINSTSIILPEYADFATSLYSKVRKNVSEIRVIFDKEKLIAVCISVSDGINTVISPIATLAEYRRKGKAAALLNSINGNVFLLCENSNRIVYEKIGFTVTGKWKEVYR